MRVVHVCLTGPFNDGWTYQENMLARHHRLAGHEVMVLATPYATDTHTGSYRWHRLGSYIDPDGVRVVRVAPVTKWVCRRWSRFNVYRGVRRTIELFSPDVIFIHGCQCLDVLAVARYCRSHLSVRVFVDNHADWLNSARNPLSMRLLHRVIWRWGVQRIDQHVTRYWGITEESCDFLADVYRVPREKIDLLPLGAAVDIAGLDDQASVRARVREDIGVAPTDLLLVTGGKIDSRKRIHEVMRAVREMKRDDVKLLVFGSVLPDIQDAFDSSLDDARIKYVGWADAESMAEYLIASDLGVFPGGQSVLWMQAVVSGIPCIFRRWPKGSPVDIGGNCRFLETDEYSELARVLAEITEVPDVYSRMKQAALGSQRWQYSYAKIAERAISEQ